MSVHPEPIAPLNLSLIPVKPMPSPFPGMNPYLESPDLWAEVHHRLITAIAIALGPRLRPKYRVAIEKCTYYSEGDQSVEVGIPDVAVLSQAAPANAGTATLPNSANEGITVVLPVPQEVREGYLEIREVATGRVITVIEVLSPSNKRSGKGRDTYEDKRRDVWSSPTHLIEIDLLRAGKPMQVVGMLPQTDYRILVARKENRPPVQFFGFNLRQPIPPFVVPLQVGDVEPVLDLQGLLHEIYNQAGFDLTLDYRQDPVPPIGEGDRDWLDTLLRSEGMRQSS